MHRWTVALASGLAAAWACGSPSASPAPERPTSARADISAEGAPTATAAETGPAVEPLPSYDPLPYDPPDEPLGVPDEVREEIRRRLEAARVTRRLRVRGERLGATTSLLQFYEGRGFHPAWFAGGRLRRADVDSLVSAVRASSTRRRSTRS